VKPISRRRLLIALLVAVAFTLAVSALAHLGHASTHRAIFESPLTV